MAEANLNLGGQESTEKKEESKAPAASTSGGKSSNGDANPALGGDQGPAIRVVVPGKPDLHIWLQGVPFPLLKVVENLTKPSSPWKSLFKDMVPGFTSIAAVLISLAALIYTNHQKNVADALAKEQREKTADVANKKVVADLISNFGRLAPTSSSQIDPNPALEISAMKIAAYGEQALPAVRMALGANDDGLRQGGILVAKLMYRAETVEHVKFIGFIDKVLNSYSASSPLLKRSILELLVEMRRDMSPEEGRSAVTMLRKSFGPRAENCASQDTRVAISAANFLPIWPSKESWELLSGMAENCPDNVVHEQASDQLENMKKKMN